MIRTFRSKAAFVLLAAASVLVLTSAAGSAAAPRKDSQGSAVAPAAAPAAPTCTSFYAPNAVGQRRVITGNNPGVYTSTTFVPMACGTTIVSLPRGRRALFVTRVDGEVTCTGTAGQWCIGRVLLRGIEGQPNAPEPDSFAWAKSNTDATDWESNSFTRTGVVGPCRTTGTSCPIVVQVQVRNHADSLSFRVDDSTVDVDVTYF